MQHILIKIQKCWKHLSVHVMMSTPLLTKKIRHNSKTIQQLLILFYFLLRMLNFLFLLLFLRYKMGRGQVHKTDEFPYSVIYDYLFNRGQFQSDKSLFFFSMCAVFVAFWVEKHFFLDFACFLPRKMRHFLHGYPV